MASLQATFMGQRSNPTAVQPRDTPQTAAPGIPTLTSAPGRRRKRMGARIAPLPESHEARTLATNTKRQRPLPPRVTQTQPVTAFQNGHNQLPSQEADAFHGTQQSFDFPGSIDQLLDQAVFDNTSCVNLESSQQDPDSKRDANDSHQKDASLVHLIRVLSDDITTLTRTMDLRLTAMDNKMAAMEKSIPRVTGERVVPAMMHSLSTIINDLPQQRQWEI
ncbi:hypothetical protein B0T10DRAFT_610205 [Thelonectria olida]|uniref:Uncharacterized protein n=1 Tax=Thelonectria olida TaxID=1576542 RepID=A0A9P8VUE3_9HYPO|nr:hypothetical protein B0T10DRAFT_610205 [Thelonectria olida]